MDLYVFSVLCLLCLCVRLFICILWSRAGKGLTSWLLFVVSNCEFALSHWYPGSGGIFDCIDSRSLLPYLLFLVMHLLGKHPSKSSDLRYVYVLIFTAGLDHDQPCLS